MNHNCSVFVNSCLRVPVDPISKMPKTAYERTNKTILDQTSIDSTSTAGSISIPDLESEKVKRFYQSIPDYNDINHLSAEEFYSTLKNLRDKRNKILSLPATQMNEDGLTEQCHDINNYNVRTNNYNVMKVSKTKEMDKVKSKTNMESLSVSKIDREDKKNMNNKDYAIGNESKDFDTDCLVNKIRNVRDKSVDKNDLKPKRNHSACSISWNDSHKIEKDEIDNRFDNFFEGKNYVAFNRNKKIKSRSLPSSPIRTKRSTSSSLTRRKSITVPKPFKMTERDEEERMVSELRGIRKSFSEDLLHQKCERKQFRARPVPIESRIPLYDKILEDQAMRRALTKINSEAELLASMKPFSFTKREENGSRLAPCERAVHLAPKTKKKKRFRARPVPKNLFSNYIYDKMKEEDFFRSLNRRIRAEELLRRSTLPGGMAIREHSRLSTPALHSDLPTDPSPVAPSATPSDRPRTRSPSKELKMRHRKFTEGDFITTTPQPFRLNTADRAAKKMMNATKKIYQSEVKNSSIADSERDARVYSALDLRAHSAGRSNLAALLRMESVKHRFEMEETNRHAEQRRRAELRARDRLLRAKPAWHMVKNNHEEDIALRLQTRRDEERMRREEFLHEMELMYGRVREQPLLFERYYAPRSLSASAVDKTHMSPRKSGKKRNSKRNKNYHFNSPNMSRKVSIHDTREELNEYLNTIDNDEKLDSDSEIVSY